MTAAMKLRHLLLGRKAMTSLDSVLKSRGITLLTKVHIIKAMVFPVVIYRYDSWTIKKAEYWRTDAFEFWCWRRLLRVPWTARRSNKTTLKEISPEYSLEGMRPKLKLQYLDYLIRRVRSMEKTLMLEKIEGKRRRGQQRMRWLESIIDSIDVNFEQPCKIVEDREAWHAVVYRVSKSWTQLSDWRRRNIKWDVAVFLSFQSMKSCWISFVNNMEPPRCALVLEYCHMIFKRDINIWWRLITNNQNLYHLGQW